MGLAISFITCLVLGQVSLVESKYNKQRHLAAFTLSEDTGTTTLGRISSVNEDVYIAYYNDSASVYGKPGENVEANESCHFVVDNINPGLSILYMPRENWGISTKVDYYDKVGSTSAWCITLVTLFMAGKWRNSEQLGEYTAPLDTLYHRCVSLNYLWEVEPTEAYEDLIRNLPKGTTIEDIYLFERWSRRCPRPLYVDEKDVVARALECHSIHGKMPLSSPDISYRDCFLNDLLGFQWNPQSKRKVNPFSRNKRDPNEPKEWNYMYTPKLADISLSLNNSIVDFCRLLASRGATAKHREIAGFLDEHISSIRLHYAVGSISSRGGGRHANFSFVMSYEAPHPVKLSAFDYASSESTSPACSSAILGHIDPLMHGNNVFNRLEYSEMTGNGQHRSVRVSITLDSGVLRKLTAPGNRIYIKVIHMLDRSVYLDNDELNNFFKRVDSDKVDKIQTSKVTPLGAGIGGAELKTIRTPFINIEDPEMRSAPVIYHGYVALEPSSLTFAKIELHYRLLLHTRYMHMNEGLTPSLAALDVDNRLPGVGTWKYDVSILAEPQVYVLKTQPLLSPVTVPSHVTTYIAFLRGISFLNVASVGYTDNHRSHDSLKAAKRDTWHRIYFTDRPKSKKSMQLCNPESSGLALVTNTFSFSRCPFREGEDHKEQEQQTYITFTVPVGEFGGIFMVIFLTVMVMVVASTISLRLTYKTFLLIAKQKRE